MSGSTKSLPVYTIEVGNPNSFTNDATIDIAATVNAELKNAPVGDQIDLVFNPGVYGETSPILLPSNTSVIGNNATLGSIYRPGHTQYGELMGNAGAYYANGGYNIENTAGVTTFNALTANSPESMYANPQNDVINSNISVQGMTFNATGYTTNGSLYSNNLNTMFGTWFTNCQNIDVQNNTYIGGTDGTAYVNVVNSVVANNIAVGQKNAAYDNWNGPVNITIEGNTSFMSAAQNTGWSVLLNSNPSGDPKNPGNATNDAIVANTFASDVTGEAAILVCPLGSYGPTQESSISVQGNVDTVLGNAQIGAFDTNGILNLTLSNNLVSDQSKTNYGHSPFSAGDNTASEVLGNETSTLSSGITSVFLSGTGNSSSNNINLSSIMSVGTLSVAPASIEAPSVINLAKNMSSNGISDIVLSELNGYIPVTIALSCLFGDITLSSPVTGVSITETSNSITLSGSIDLVNQELSNLVYSPNASNWDDSLDIQVDPGQPSLSTTDYIPILIQPSQTISSVTTIAPGFLNQAAVEASLPYGQSIPASSYLTGQILIASSGNDLLSMGTLNSLAFLGSGNDTVDGGSTSEYIAGGSGNSTINLNAQGDVTVVGGSGSLTVNSNLGNNFIEAGVANMTINSVAGNLSVLGGSGNISLNGGSGNCYVAMLPQSDGVLNANLGPGSSTVLASSGNDSIVTQSNSSDIIYLGTGSCEVDSYGYDTIYGGAGDSSVNLFAGAQVQITPGTSPTTVHIDCVEIILVPGSRTLYAKTGAEIDSVIFSDGLSVYSDGKGSDTRVYFSSPTDIVSVIGSASITGTKGNQEIYGGDGDLSYSNEFRDSHTSIFGGSGQSNISVAGYSSISVAGSANICTGRDSTEILGFGNYNINADIGVGGVTFYDLSWGNASLGTSSGGHDTIYAGYSGEGSTSISSAGIDNIISDGTTKILALAGSDDNISVTGGSLFFSEEYPGIGSASTAGICLSSGSATIEASGISYIKLSFLSGNSQLDYINNSLLSQIVGPGSTGSTTISGGLGGGCYYGGTAGNNSLIGGLGVVTLVGAGSNDYLEARSSKGINNLVAGGGNETLSATVDTSSNYFVLNNNSSGVVSTCGSGQQSFFIQDGSSCNETIYGSNAATASNFYNIIDAPMDGNGVYTFIGFNGENSDINVSFLNSSSNCTISQNSVDGETSTLLKFGNTLTINLENTPQSSLKILTDQSNGTVSIT